MKKKRTAKQILTNPPKTNLSLRLPGKLLDFLDEQVKSAKEENATRSALIEGILLDWCKDQGMKGI